MQESGTEVFPGARVERAVSTYGWLRRQSMRHTTDPKLDVVVYERPFVRGRDATRCLWGLAGMVEGIFGDYAAILDVTPAGIKAWATGSGKASKEDMIRAADRLIGRTPRTEHEADAILLGLYTHEKAEVTT